MGDFVTDGYDSSGGDDKPGEWPYIVAEIASTVITIAVCITFILICLTTPKVRKDTSKWLQLLVATSVLSFKMTDIFIALAGDTGAHRLWKLRGLCDFLLPLHKGLKLLIPCGVGVVSIERLVTLWKGMRTASSFTKKTAAVVSGVLVVAILVFCYTIHIVYGGSGTVKIDGVYICAVADEVVAVYKAINPVAPVILLLLTIIMVGRLIKARHCDGDEYPRDRILPFILGNVLMIMGAFLAMGVANVKGGARLSAFNPVPIIVLLIWLLGQSDTRTVVRTNCCPCLPDKNNGDVQMA